MGQISLLNLIVVTVYLSTLSINCIIQNTYKSDFQRPLETNVFNNELKGINQTNFNNSSLTTDEFNQKIYSTNVYSQTPDSLTVDIIQSGVNSVQYSFSGGSASDQDRCFFIDKSTHKELSCSVPNSLELSCSCIGEGLILDLTPETEYTIDVFLNNMQHRIGTYQVVTMEIAFLEEISHGIRSIKYSVRRQSSLPIPAKNCRVCLYDRNTDQGGKCCSKKLIRDQIDEECSGNTFSDLKANKEFIMEGCDYAGDHWFNSRTYTASRPIRFILIRNGTDYTFFSKYENFHIPELCTVYLGSFEFPANCIIPNGCNCEYGIYDYQSSEKNVMFYLKDYANDTIFSILVDKDLIEYSKESNLMSIGVIAGIVIAAVAVIVAVSLGIFFLTRNRNIKIIRN